MFMRAFIVRFSSRSSRWLRSPKSQLSTLNFLRTPASGWLQRLVRRLLCSIAFSAHNLVLNTLQILEVESVVAPGSIFWILSWWTHYFGLNSIHFAMQSVDFGARFR